MQILFILGIIIVTSGIFLLSSQFAYKKQSFVLGMTGALGGGVMATFIKNGYEFPGVQSLLLFSVAGLILLYLLKQYFSISDQ